MADSTTPEFDQRLGNIEKKLDSIANAIAVIAVQDEKIIHLEKNVSKLWEKYDQGFGQSGVITKVMQYQASCPRTEVDRLNVRVWGLIISMLLLITGLAVRLLQQ